MPIRCPSNILVKLFHLTLIITVAILPLAPASSLAANSTESEKIIEVTEQSKIPVVTTESKTEISQETSTQVDTLPETQVDTSPEPETTPPVEVDKPMSTGMKVALGVGAGVVVIAGVAALAGGGSGDSTPTPPTTDQVVGAWHANAICIDGRTYSGTYTLYAGGSHYFDITISDGTHVAGSGAWNLDEYDLELRNYQHSTYQGTFAERIKTTVTLYATDGRWKLVLTK
ncbi:hypothetical protein [Desulforhopalus sp. IMCC35007]|uniref:hypothetical protein n=1 Tax=Desulforhopalus sp. IMCC35007 TaxID=2569543 RepID=UPI0010AEC575|nr:hypothetical protein [Desulforhopalus sp. IMCC35007]TKB09151.1 hypothetical protein FCL48_11825 [Desulforhopalus sp. IMCC35007]